MPDDRVFMMGKFEARLPGDRLYARNHMWCKVEGDVLRFGFTSYAIRLMQDVYFLDWTVSPGDEVTRLQDFGHIETSKAVSDLFAPQPGRVIQFNSALLDDPSGVNVDGYGNGWLFEMAGPPDGELMTVDEYHAFLDANWEKTQRVIKGKINTDE
jgi:glycine cleavage system H protein